MKRLRRRTSTFRPHPARRIGNRQQRPPVVGGTIMKAVGYGGVGLPQPLQMVMRPSQQSRLPFLELRLHDVLAEPLRPGPLYLPTHPNDDRPILQRARQTTDQPEYLRTPCVEARRGEVLTHTTD